VFRPPATDRAGPNQKKRGTARPQSPAKAVGSGVNPMWVRPRRAGVRPKAGASRSRVGIVSSGDGDVLGLCDRVNLLHARAIDTRGCGAGGHGVASQVVP
jgi:hypothetical protein